MTIDKDKLRALAEAATQGEWKFDGGTVNDWRDGEYSMEWMANGEDCEDGTNANWRADGEYIAAASPATILALLAEIERLKERNVYWIDQANTIAVDRNSIRNERDQLKDENEALRKALGEISGQVDGNIRCAVRDVVNCRGDVQDIYGYCDNIDEIIEAAMAKEDGQ
ncbi:hypothetical protein GLGCALEP_03457 [Pseudomonas sp. MM221]|nr:hypothetical protein DBADOPDK_03382 [Pseudomonas sp. MM223]CAI3804314.1 hypothetical protein GLGCALEP_03457 [Pseudomonas sp. MM221]